MHTPNRAKTRTRGYTLLRNIMREATDLYVYRGKIDWIFITYTLLCGAFLGAFSALLISADNVLTIPFRLLVVALGALAGALTFMVGTLVLTLTIAILEQVAVRRVPTRRRRKDLREEIRYLRKTVRTGHILLADVGRVTAHLRMRDEQGPHPEASFRERRLWQRLQRHRRRTDAVLETSWRESLQEAIETLRLARATRSTQSLVIDDVPTAWYLERTPANLAVSRLLVEYVDGTRDRRTGNVVFPAGVVFTPRWVYELVRAGTHDPRVRYMTSANPYEKRSKDGIGNECVDIGNADRETVAKLYDHDGSGPMKSLWDTIEAAKRL